MNSPNVTYLGPLTEWELWFHRATWPGKEETSLAPRTPRRLREQVVKERIAGIERRLSPVGDYGQVLGVIPTTPCVKGPDDWNARYSVAVRIVLDLFGPKPEGARICRRCDNPSCVAPDHLFYASRRDHVSDMLLKGRPERKRELERELMKLRKELLG